jgi:hypothetical protein
MSTVRIAPRSGVSWVGDPLESGSFIVSHSGTRPSEVVAELMFQIARKNGIAITPDLIDEIHARALEHERRFVGEIQARGIAGTLRKLLQTKRKKDAVRVASVLVLTPQDLMALICNCGSLGLSHHAKHLEFVPDQRELTDHDRSALTGAAAADGEARAKAAAKLHQLFEEREHRSVHLFADSRERWHCFFLTFRDVGGEPSSGSHHWRGGAHLHYVSHLFDSKLTKERVWTALEHRKHSLPSEHIRFREPDDGRGGQRVYLDPIAQKAVTL